MLTQGTVAPWPNHQEQGWHSGESTRLHFCDPGVVPVVGTWVEFVVGSLLAPRVFSEFSSSSLHKNQHFQIRIKPKCQVFTHELLAREIRRLLPTP